MVCKSIVPVWHCVHFTTKKHQALKFMRTIFIASDVGSRVTVPDLSQSCLVSNKRKQQRRLAMILDYASLMTGRSPSLLMRSYGQQTITIGGSEMLTSPFLSILQS